MNEPAPLEREMKAMLMDIESAQRCQFVSVHRPDLRRRQSYGRACSPVCIEAQRAQRSTIVARDWRDDRIEELETLVRAQQATIAALERRIQELEALLARYSGNSSRLPSSDPPGAPPPAPAKRTGRKRGGQRGHAKFTRALVPPERGNRPSSDVMAAALQSAMLTRDGEQRAA